MLFVSDIRKTYFYRPVLKSVSFSVQLGEVVGVLGKNGAGKSTLFRIISGIASLDKGTVKVGESSVASGNIHPRKKLFYIGHAPGLYPSLSAVENLSLALSLRNIDVSETTILDALAKVQLSSQADDAIKIYSQGMLQRLKLALCDVIPWTILLIDEPFTGLDTQGRSLAEKMIDGWKSSEKSIMMVVHDMAWAIENCSRILVIHEGVIGLDSRTKNHAVDIQAYYDGLMV
jgi:ABC-type multidrug transport system ATPase subunit